MESRREIGVYELTAQMREMQQLAEVSEIPFKASQGIIVILAEGKD